MNCHGGFDVQPAGEGYRQLFGLATYFATDGSNAEEARKFRAMIEREDVPIPEDTLHAAGGHALPAMGLRTRRHDLNIRHDSATRIQMLSTHPCVVVTLLQACPGPVLS